MSALWIVVSLHLCRRRYGHPADASPTLPGRLELPERGGGRAGQQRLPLERGRGGGGGIGMKRENSALLLFECILSKINPFFRLMSFVTQYSLLVSNTQLRAVISFFFLLMPGSPAVG